MSEIESHAWLCGLIAILGVVTFVALFFIAAPYGRHYDGRGWGPKIATRVGWVIMESPSVFIFVVVFAFGSSAGQLVPILLLGIWQLHYLHRTLIFPFRLKAAGKSIPVLIVALGFTFNVLNSYLNARWISELGKYSIDWIAHPLFLFGIALFLGGFILNIHSDSVLFRLRQPGETGYRIPRGGAYRWVSSPNYLGELIEWLGWALATWSFSGFAFLLYSLANLVPRSASHHNWYRKTFTDYPANRKRLIPHVY